MKKIFLTLVVATMTVGSMAVAAPTSAVPSEYKAYDISIDPLGKDMSIEEKKKYLVPFTVSTQEDIYRRVGNITVQINKLTDKQWLLIRNFLDYGNMFTAQETKAVFIEKWRHNRPHPRGEAQLTAIESVIGRALMDENYSH